MLRLVDRALAFARHDAASRRQLVLWNVAIHLLMLAGQRAFDGLPRQLDSVEDGLRGLVAIGDADGALELVQVGILDIVFSCGLQDSVNAVLNVRLVGLEA